MKKNILNVLVTLLVVMPFVVHASDEGFYEVASETKYYKTIHYTSNVSTFSTNNDLYKTVEISKEEYDLVDENSYSVNDSASIGTEYKSMTTSILANGSYYRYKNILSWKKMPKTRSYDIIAIGYPSNVRPLSTATFSQYYCISGEGCTTQYNGSFLYFDNGVGASFKLPTGTLQSLKQTLYFDVKKNTSATIKTQSASGDYAHAQKAVSLADSKKYTMDPAGIYLVPSVADKYDTISEAHVSWNGTW